MDLMQKLLDEDILRRKELNLPPALIDEHRVYPVDTLIIHHSAGNEFLNSEALPIIDAFDSAGWARGYKPINRVSSGHSHPFKDKETFAMAHFALHRYTRDNNAYNWRLVPLMSDWFHNVAWHAGDLAINRRSIGIEICGDYTEKCVDEKALQLIADYFRPYYLALSAVWIRFVINAHCNVSQGVTVCPGKIREQIPALKKMIFS
jgi:hypothetical protein